jgi:hypothetical protein
MTASDDNGSSPAVPWPWTTMGQQPQQQPVSDAAHEVKAPYTCPACRRPCVNTYPNHILRGFCSLDCRSQPAPAVYRFICPDGRSWVGSAGNVDGRGGGINRSKRRAVLLRLREHVRARAKYRRTLANPYADEDHQDLVAEHQDLVARHEDLIAKHQLLTIQHRDFVVFHKDFAAEHKSLVARHRATEKKHQDLEAAHRALTAEHAVIVTELRRCRKILERERGRRD